MKWMKGYDINRQKFESFVCDRMHHSTAYEILQKKWKEEQVHVWEGGKILLKQKILPLFWEDGRLFMLEPVTRDEMEEEEESAR